MTKRIKEQENREIDLAMKQVWEQLKAHLVLEHYKSEPDYKKVYKDVTRQWVAKAKAINEKTRTLDANLKALDEWIWSFFKDCRRYPKLMGPKDKILRYCMRKAVGRKWRFEKWLNDLN